MFDLLRDTQNSASSMVQYCGKYETDVPGSDA